MKTTIIGISYVSIWVIIWGTIGSLIDFPLLKLGIYTPASLGQITTFLLTFLVCSVLAKNLFPELQKRFQ